jgi:hypothetical protein
MIQSRKPCLKQLINLLLPPLLLSLSFFLSPPISSFAPLAPPHLPLTTLFCHLHSPPLPPSFLSSALFTSPLDPFTPLLCPPFFIPPSAPPFASSVSLYTLLFPKYTLHLVPLSLSNPFALLILFLRVHAWPDCIPEVCPASY